MKIVLLLIALAAIGVALVGAFNRVTFHVEVDVPAPPEAVWAVLTDTERYPEWNPTQTAITGRHVEGEKITATFAPPQGDPLSIEMNVMTVDAPKRLRNGGGTPGVLTFDHSWILEPIDGGTRVIQHEVNGGIGMWFWDYSWIEPAYLRASEALRDRVLALEAEAGAMATESPE